MSSATVDLGEDALKRKLESMTISEEKPSDSEEPKVIKHKVPRKYAGKVSFSDRLAAWEEAQKDKVTVATGIKGTVKWYSIIGRYGFIERSDGEGDIFVHQSGISNSKAEKGYLRTLADDEEVEFDIVKGKKGEEAVNVCGPEGTAVKGAKAYRILIRNRRTFQKEKNDEVGKAPRKDSRKSEDKEKADGDHDDKPRKVRRRPNRRFYKKPSKDNGDTSMDVPEEDFKKETRGSRRRANSGPAPAPKEGANGDAAMTSLDALLA